MRDNTKSLIYIKLYFFLGIWAYRWSKAVKSLGNSKPLFLDIFSYLNVSYLQVISFVQYRPACFVDKVEKAKSSFS